jgi:pSer/pThr/pTyr-binding forkhead associated (FHA) protein
MKLLFPNGEHADTRLREGATRVGSKADSDVLLVAPGIAYEHCVIEISGEDGTIEPLAPANLVVLNGRQVEGCTPIKPGDIVLFAKIGARVVASEAAPRAAIVPGQPSAAPATPVENRTRVRPNLPRFALRGLSGSTFGKIYPLSGTQTIGREPECDIAIVDGEISRQHARLREQADGVAVEDLGSSNGTFLNGVRIDAGVARGGDELRFDTLRFVVQAPDTPIARDDAPAPPPMVSPAPPPKVPKFPIGIVIGAALLIAALLLVAMR